MKKYILQTWNKRTKEYDIEVVIKEIEKPKVIKKERKNKRKAYPKEFTQKRRGLLDTAREGLGCTACGTRDLLQVHHIDKDIYNNCDSNLLVLCFYCHSKEHKHMQGKQPPKWLL